jgi:ankyrin repeat protein
MNATYLRILEKIDKQVPARRNIVRQTLKWVVNAGRPLKLRELALAVSIKPNSTSHKDLKEYEQEVILDICGNLLAVNDGIVRPVHYTVQEFLTASETNRMDGPGNSVFCQYQINIHMHSELAQTCLQYLLFEEIRSPQWVAGAESSDERFPFGLYAAGYWDYHVQRLPDSTLPDDLVRSIDKFLDSDGQTLTLAFHMRNREYRPYATVNALNYRLAFNLLHLYQLSHRLDTSAARDEYQDALHHAAGGGSTASIDILLGMGFSVNGRTRDEYRECPLQYAAAAGHTAAAELLLDRGAHVDATTRDGSTALKTAAWRGHESLVQMLLKRGADVNRARGHNCWDDVYPGGNYQGSALAAAAEGGDRSTVQRLLDSGADVNLTGGKYGTALAAAAETGEESIVQILLDNGADVNLTGKKHASALELATRYGYKDILRLLLDKGAVSADTEIVNAI